MIRAATRAALATAVTAKVEALGATVYRWPMFVDPSPTRVTFVVRDITGTVDLPVFDGSSKARNVDTWRLDAVCRAEASLQTIGDAEQLAEDLAEAVRAAVHADPSLGGLSRAAQTTAHTWRLRHVIVVQVEGPEVLELDDGPAAVCVVTLEAVAQIF